MENIYEVQIKGVRDNNNCWSIKASFYTLPEAIYNYNSYKSGCCKRIVRIQKIKKEKIMRYKKY